MAELIAVVTLTALAAYATLGGADFGVGVWDITAGRGPRAHAIRSRLALSSILTPFFLGAAIGGIASGRVPVGNAAGDALTSWWNPTSVLTGVLAVVTGAYLAAVWAGADAARQGESDLAEAFRRRALIGGVVAGAAAVGGIVVLRADVPELADDLLGKALPLTLLSVLAGAVTLALVFVRRLALARATSAVAVAGIIWAWGYAQAPDILPGALTIDEAAAAQATLVGTVVAVVALVLIVGPSLWYLWRLAAEGALGHEDVTIEETDGSPR